MGGWVWLHRHARVRWLAALLPLTLLTSLVAGVAARPAHAASGPPPGAVRPFTVLASPEPVTSGVTVAAGGSANLRVAGVDGVPASGLTSVAVRVSVTASPGRGSSNVPNGTVAISPWAPPESPAAGRPAATPAAAPAQFVAYRGTGTASGFALVGAGDGALKVTNVGKAPVTVGVEVEGYAGSGGAVVPLATPLTLSAGATISAGQRESLAVAGVPASNVAGLLVELTASAPAAGQLTGAGSGALLDYAPGGSVSGLAVLGESGGRVTLANDSAAAARVSAVIVGYLSDGPAAGGGPLTAVTPAPVTSSPVLVAAGGSVSVPVAGRGGIPAAGVAGAALGISATAAGPGRSGTVSVGLTDSPAVASAAAATVCPSSFGTCSGFAVAGLSGPASDGAVLVHNFSDQAVSVTLSAFGYLSAATVPAAPAALTVRARGGSALLSWRPPASGGTTITGYAVTVSPGGRQLTVSGRSSSLTVPDVPQDVTSTFTVAAVNAAGRGAAAAAGLVPAGTPAAPGKVSARADGRGRFLVTWTPAAANGAPIAGYTVTAAPSRVRVAASASATSAVVTSLPGGAAYVPCVTTTSATGATAQSCAGPLLVGSSGAVAQATAVTPGSSFTPVSPVRLMDTRSGLGGVTGPVAADKSVSLQVAGVDGVPSSGVTAVVMNVTVTTPTANGLLTVYPDGASVPVVSNLNFGSGETVPNLVTVEVGSDGKVDFYNGASGTTQVLADLAGYYSASGSSFTPVSPVRLMDTRSGLGGVTGPVAADKSVSLQVAGVDGVPSSGVTAVVMNVTVTTPTANGLLTVYPDGASVPVVSNLNFGSGETVPNLVTVEVGSDGKVDFYNGASGTTQVLADLAGYYSASGSSFTPVSPVRLMDTRSGLGGVTGPVAADKSVSLQVAGVDGVPSSGVTAVVMNVTVTTPTANGLLTVYPDGASVPVVSNLNFGSGETVPNLVTVEVGSDGKVDFYNGASGTTQILADLAGYYVAPLGAPTGITAAAGNAQATVSWTVPQWDGGTPVTGYTVTASNGTTVSAAATATSATVTGLANGTSYTFTVTAANSTGTGPASATSNAVIPSAPPGAPTGVTATAGNGQATVTWTAPTSTGGGAITSYKVAASPGSTTVTVAGTVTTATVTGLANGTAYTFTVTAATVGGAGPASAASAAVTPATAPGAPTGVTATAGKGQATVTWTPPASNGGSPVTGYTVTASDGTTIAAAATSTSATVTGLTNGTSYTFTVTATNAAGVSAASTASNAVTPTGPPDSPSFTGWTVGNGQATLDWQAPVNNGGEPVTGYTITMEPGGITYLEAATATSLTVTGLTDGTSYSFSITATNELGPGPAADAVGPVIPITVPGAPTAVTATAASGSATVTWTAPATEGSEVTGYTVTAAPGGASVTVPGTASAATLTGLTNGTAYTFTVTAADAAGTGTASAPSAAVTPGPVPAPPVDVQATTGNATATVTWAAPASAGGSAITSYIVTAGPGSTTVTVPGTTLTATFTGLADNTSYRFTVLAVNSYGDSAPSGSSPAVTPTAPAAPDAPFITNVTGEDSAVEVTWVPPDTGTADLTGYVITTSAGGSAVSTLSGRPPPPRRP